MMESRPCPVSPQDSFQKSPEVPGSSPRLLQGSHQRSFVCRRQVHAWQPPGTPSKHFLETFCLLWREGKSWVATPDSFKVAAQGVSSPLQADLCPIATVASCQGVSIWGWGR